MKMLKLYSWQDAFEKAIQEKRDSELEILYRRFKIDMMNVTSLYFFPQIMSAVVFSVFIGTGNNLSLSVAYTVNTIFNLIKVNLSYSSYLT